jgi:hypothetical protein
MEKAARQQGGSLLGRIAPTEAKPSELSGCIVGAGKGSVKGKSGTDSARNNRYEFNILGDSSGDGVWAFRRLIIAVNLRFSSVFSGCFFE